MMISKPSDSEERHTHTKSRLIGIRWSLLANVSTSNSGPHGRDILNRFHQSCKIYLSGKDIN
jgi:hypothetical protein